MLNIFILNCPEHQIYIHLQDAVVARLWHVSRPRAFPAPLSFCTSGCTIHPLLAPCPRPMVSFLLSLYKLCLWWLGWTWLQSFGNSGRPGVVGVLSRCPSTKHCPGPYSRCSGCLWEHACWLMHCEDDCNSRSRCEQGTHEETPAQERCKDDIHTF